MKIVIVGTAHPFRGGLASYNQRLAKAFKDLGHEIHIETFTTQYPSFLFPGKTQFSSSSAPSDIKINRSFSSINPITWLKLGRRLRREKPDLVLFKFWLPFMGPAFGFIARLIKRNNHTRVITILDNVIPHEPRIGDVLFTKYYLKSSDAFVAMSSAVFNDLKKFNKDKPRIINPHPLFDNFGEPVTKQEACQFLDIDSNYNYLLFFGFIRGYKGLDILLNALDKEKMKKSNLKLIIAGEFYDDEEYYTDIIRSKDLESYIIGAHHFIKDEDVKYYFSAADVVVQPYKNATQSGVTQIAYQFNKPMIVTNVGGLPELVEDKKAGYLVDVNAQAICRAIENIYDSDTLEQMTNFVQKKKHSFAWETMVHNIFELKAQIS